MNAHNHGIDPGCMVTIDPEDREPDEPTGLGAVVEAINDNRFVRVGVAGWVHEEDCSAEPCDWRDIAVVRVLSAGVTA